MREDVSSSCISRHGDILRLDDRPFYCDELHRSGLLAWLKELKGVTVDLPTMPPLYIIHHRDLLEKGWGWQRLLPYRGSVDWTVYKGYLKEYCSQNDGEVTALCVNNKPYEDKSFFSRNAGFGVASDYDTLLFAANLSVEAEINFRLCFHDELTDDEMQLSHQIQDRANHVIQSPGEYCAATAAAALVCIVKETELLFELLLSDDDVETTEMTALSKQVRQTALELILCRGPESAAVAGAMVGLAKEAKIMRYLLSRVDRRVYMDYSVCALIRKHTAEALTKFVTEFACKSPSNGDVKASTKSEKPGIVGDLKCEESDSTDHSNKGVNKCCEIGSMAKLKDDELEGEASTMSLKGKPLQTSETWKASD